MKKLGPNKSKANEDLYKADLSMENKLFIERERNKRKVRLMWLKRVNNLRQITTV